MKQILVKGRFTPEAPGLLVNKPEWDMPLLVPFNHWVLVDDDLADYIVSQLPDRASAKKDE